MNFKWENDIYDRKPSSNASNSEEEKAEYSEPPLPWYFKIIGLGMAFLAVIYGINDLFLHLSFMEKVKVPENLLLFFIAAGCFLETFTHPVQDTEEANERREFIQAFFIGLIALSLTPFIGPFFKFIWG